MCSDQDDIGNCHRRSWGCRRSGSYLTHHRRHGNRRVALSTLPSLSCKEIALMVATRRPTVLMQIALDLGPSGAYPPTKSYKP